MAINRIFIQLGLLKNKNNNENNWNYFFNVFLIAFFFIISIIVVNLINQKNKKESQNFEAIIETEEFSNLSNFFISKINSPYQEINYTIKNNDSVEKILNKFSINKSDINNISENLKKKKLTNIYAGRKLKLVLKRLEDQTNTVVSLLYPLSNTSNIEIRKIQDGFSIKESILQL